MRPELPRGIMPDPRAQLPDLLIQNQGLWVSHETLGPGVYRHASSTGDECITVRAQMPPGGILAAESCLRLADLVERYAQVGRRTSRNAFEFVGVDRSRLEDLISELAAIGYPVGGTGNSLHQIKACGGFASCQNCAIDSPTIAKTIGDLLFADVVSHRYPAHLKVSVTGCPNQCGGGLEADIGIVGMFKGIPQVDDASLLAARCDVPLLCFWCPTGAIKPKPVRGGMSVEINPDRCIRCTSCANLCPQGVTMSGQRGVAVAVGGVGSNTRKGPEFAKLLVPFMPVSSQLEIDPLLDLVSRVIDSWRNGAAGGERIVDYVERIGWPAFMRKVDVPFDLNLVDNFAPLSVRRNLQVRW